MRLHFPAATGWEHPSVTIAAYDTPTGTVRWSARFEDTVPEEVVGSLLCAVAHDLAQPDRYDQQRALRGPVLTDPADILDNGSCPGATSTRCGCPQLLGLDLTGNPRRAEWRMWGRSADGRRWRAWFDQTVPRHLIAAACHLLAADRTRAYTQAEDGDTLAGEPGDHDAADSAEPAQRPDRCPNGTQWVPFETVLAVAREVVQQTGRTGARAIATGVRARGIAIGTKRAQRIAAVLQAEHDAALR